MKRLYLISIIVLCVSCIHTNNKDIVRFQRVESARTLHSLVKDVEWIPLQTHNAPLIGASTELFVLNDSSYLVLDKEQSAIFRFSQDGTFKNYIGRKGNGPGEYVSIYNIQISEDRVIVFSRPDKLLYYDYSGVFISEDHLNDMGIQSYHLRGGDVLTYYGFGSGRGYRLGLLSKGDIIPFLPDNSNVIHFSPDAPVFSAYGQTVFFTDAYKPVIHMYNDKTVSSYCAFDFGRSSIPDEFYSFEEPFAAMEYLLSREFAMIQRFLQNDHYSLMEVFIQSQNKVQAYYGIQNNNKWDWFWVGKMGKSAFAGYLKTMDDSSIYFMVDPHLLLNKEPSCPFQYDGLLNGDDNPVIVKIRLK